MKSNYYHSTGIFTGYHTLEERNAFIEAWVKRYDERYPGNTVSIRRKKRSARKYWHQRVLKELEKLRPFESLLPARVGDAP